MTPFIPRTSSTKCQYFSDTFYSALSLPPPSFMVISMAQGILLVCLFLFKVQSVRIWGGAGLYNLDNILLKW